MSEHKFHQFRPALYSQDGGTTQSQRSVVNEQHGWDAYRKWLSRASAKSTTVRAPLDQSIYSWRGYHTWADKIKQTWKGEG